MLAELYPWKSEKGENRSFFYASSSHNSVVGMRGKSPRFSAFDESCLRAQQMPSSANESVAQGSLMCFPAQCNFAGTKYALENVSLWQSKGYKVLLDAAALVGNSPLDLSTHSPDYVVISFYKMFGSPTGIGALLIKKSDSVSSLASNKLYFGGGTVGAVLYDFDWVRLRSGLEESLEDGTVNFQSIAALKHGFAALERVGGVSKISRHVFAQAHYLASKISSLKHWNGTKVCELYGWSEEEVSESSKTNLESIHRTHGAVVAINLRRADGSWVGHNEFERLASQRGFQLRTGCFCNPGACQKYLKMTSESIVRNYQRGHRCWDDNDLDPINGNPIGAIRVSFPYFARKSATIAFLKFIETFYVESSPPICKPLEDRGEAEKVPKLERICVFPIKSCGGFDVSEWNLVTEGLEYDREWMLVDQKGKFVNQKAEPKMTLITARIDGAEHKLCITAPGMIPLEIDTLDYPEEQFDFEVCGDTCPGRVYDEKICRWFTTFLGSEPVRLVRLAPEAERKAKVAGCSPENAGMCQSSAVRFTNEAQFLIVNQSSLDEVRQRLIANNIGLDGESKSLEEDIERVASERLNNMRSNLTISGRPAFDEDHWSVVSIGENLRFKIAGDCARCRMITIDPETGKSHREPLHTLSTFRRKHGRVIFGVLAVHDPVQNPIPIRVGMPVTIKSDLSLPQ